jgi:hypothetical protein
MQKKTKEFNAKDHFELHRWKDDGGSDERHEVHPPGREPTLARDARSDKPELPRRFIQGSRSDVRPGARGIPCGWQSKPLHSLRQRRQREVFLDFDPVCPEWPIAEDGG